MVRGKYAGFAKIDCWALLTQRVVTRESTSERIRPPPVITRNVSEAAWDAAVALQMRRAAMGGLAGQ